MPERTSASAPRRMCWAERWLRTTPKILALCLHSLSVGYPFHHNHGATDPSPTRTSQKPISRTSENSVNAKFAESAFHVLGCREAVIGGDDTALHYWGYEALWIRGNFMDKHAE